MYYKRIENSPSFLEKPKPRKAQSLANLLSNILSNTHPAKFKLWKNKSYTPFSPLIHMIGFTQMMKVLHPGNCSVISSWCSVGPEPSLPHSVSLFQIIPSSIWDVEPDTLGSSLASTTL